MPSSTRVWRPVRLRAPLPREASISRPTARQLSAPGSGASFTVSARSRGSSTGAGRGWDSRVPRALNGLRASRSATPSARISTGSCVSARIVAERLLIVVLGTGAAVAGCQRDAPFDPATQALAILSECGADSSCVHERWRRDPRGWNLGLRAEVAGRRPQAPFVVDTTRELVTPELAAAGCL